MALGSPHIRHGWASAVLAVVVLATSGCAGTAGSERAAAGSTEPDRLVGPADPAGQLDFSLVLRMDQDALDSFLVDVLDPTSPEYRRFLTAAQFGQRFGLSPTDLRRVQARLRTAGFRVDEPFGQRVSLAVHGTVARVGAFFDMTMGQFDESSGDRYRAPLTPPVIPTDLRDAVVAVAGLSNRPTPQPHLAVRAVPAEGVSPEVLATAFGVRLLWDAGIRGQGQTVAIISFTTFNDADVRTFDRLVGIDGAPPVLRRPVDGGATIFGPPASIENALDIDVIRAVAPMAQIINYEAPFSNRLQGPGSFVQEMGQAIVDDGRATIGSLSWGICDSPSLAGGAWLDPGDRFLVDGAISSAVAAGVTIFSASGDQGAYDCQRFFEPDQRLTVGWPSSPGLVLVGGTLLSLQDDLSYREETGWEDVLSKSATGGGLSPVDPRPDWQQGPGVDNAFSNGLRQVPDVSGPADPDSGYLVVEGGRQITVGGTSGAAPFWAGSLALIAQSAEEGGVGPLGYVNPMLYDLARTPQALPPFRDVVRGGNRFHNCTPGWDYATGLGSPHVFNLAQDVIQYLAARA